MLSRRLTRPCRPVESRPACAPPTLYWQRCGEDGCAIDTAAYEFAPAAPVTSDPGCRPGLCGKTRTSTTIAARIAPEAKGRLNARPPWLVGLSRKSPTVAPRGRVNM